MHEFKYRGSHFYCEDVRVADVARRFGTPLFVYSYQTIIDHFLKLKRAFSSIHPLICYSVKANSNLAILKSLIQRGAGLDVVSGGELFRALKAGCPANKIVYASVGKTNREIEEAVKKKILFFNVESVGELENINRISKKLKTCAQVALRINPDVEPKTHSYITTGTLTNKFGIDFRRAYQILLLRKALPYIRIKGLHIHIGSQITESAPYVAAIRKMAEFISSLRRTGVRIEYLNIGGGLGIVYDRENPQTAHLFADKILPLLKKTETRIILEPGRFIVGNAGVLVTRVLYVKSTPHKKFIIVDAGMNDLIRPALYEAYHQILPLRSPDERGRRVTEKVDIVGPICESGDFFAKARTMPKLQEGDYLGIMGAGAYGFSMSSNYNSRLKAQEVLVGKDRVFVIRTRDRYSDLIRHEKIPASLSARR